MYHTIKNQQSLYDYAAAAGPLIAKRGGQVLARGGAVTVLEGGPAERTNVVMFPSLDSARSFYDSAEYQAARDLLKDVVRDVRIVEATT